MQDRFIYTTDDVLRMLDALLADRGGGWWDEFYADRTRPVPFFTEWPGKARQCNKAARYEFVYPRIVITALAPGRPPDYLSPVSALTRAAIAGWRRSLSRQRPRVGPMLPGGMPSRALTAA